MELTRLRTLGRRKKRHNANLHRGGMRGRKEDKLVAELESIASGKKPIIEIPIPLSDTEFAFIKMPHPLTNAQWEKIESILKAYKPADETAVANHVWKETSCD